MQAITTIEECNIAAQAIGNSDVTASATTTSPRPEGCYDKEGRLWFATDPINQGNGADSTRNPICKRGLLQTLSIYHCETRPFWLRFESMTLFVHFENCLCFNRYLSR